MVIVTLVTADERLVGLVEVLPFVSPPEVLIWGERVFKFVRAEPRPTYRECFTAVSLTSGEQCAALTRGLNHA